MAGVHAPPGGLRAPGSIACVNEPESSVLPRHLPRRPMQEEKDATLKIRLPSELKDELRQIAETDPDTEGLSEWVRRELKAGLRIEQRKQET